MSFKISCIDIGYGQKWPIDLLLLSLTEDRELGETEWWRRMATLQNAAAQSSDGSLLIELNKAKEIRFGSRFPIQEVTTSQNMPPTASLENTIYFGPMKSLQVMLSNKWFDQVSTDTVRFDLTWRDRMVNSLMTSCYRDDIAQGWGKADQRLQIKGRFIGALMAAGVLGKSALCIARLFYGTGVENTKEVKTLAKYMGDCRKENYIEWIKDYVKTGT